MEKEFESVEHHQPSPCLSWALFWTPNIDVSAKSIVDSYRPGEPFRHSWEMQPRIHNSERLPLNQSMQGTQAKTSAMSVFVSRNKYIFCATETYQSYYGQMVIPLSKTC